MSRTTAEPGWVTDTRWWRVYPLGFAGAYPAIGNPGPDEHRLLALVPWLDHVASLALTGVALGPIAASATHGYDTLDHRKLDPRLGEEADFDALVAAAHDRGLRVQLDGVFNHVARAHPLAQRALAEGPDSEAMAWFKPWPLWDGRVELANFEGSDDLVELNHDSPQLREYLISVMCHWLERGVDSWRLDAAYRVPTSFWDATLPVVWERHPEAYFEAEVIHGDYVAFVAESKADCVTQYELWKAIWSAIATKNWFELDWALQRHNEFLGAFVPATFLGNHDTTRIASQIADPRHRPHALVLLATLGGTPAIYAGDEFGWQAVKEDRPGGDDAVRPKFDSPAEVLDALDDDGRATMALHRDLLALRRDHPWLHRAQTTPVLLTNTQYVYDVAGAGGCLRVALNLDDAPLQVPDGETVPPHGWAINPAD